MGQGHGQDTGATYGGSAASYRRLWLVSLGFAAWDSIRYLGRLPAVLRGKRDKITWCVLKRSTAPQHSNRLCVLPLFLCFLPNRSRKLSVYHVLALYWWPSAWSVTCPDTAEKLPLLLSLFRISYDQLPTILNLLPSSIPS